MTPTREQIAAYADDQLGEVERGQIEMAIAADPVLQAEVAAHRALKGRLASHFAALAAAPVPDRLAALLAPQSAEVIDFAAVRERRRGLPRWGWIAGPALAASLVLAVVLRPQQGDQPGYAGAELARALDRQLASNQPAAAPVRILLSFRAASGQFCRAYSESSRTGIACRGPAGWKLLERAERSDNQVADYRQAGSAAETMEVAQDLATGPALDDAGEKRARDLGWRAER